MYFCLLSHLLRCWITLQHFHISAVLLLFALPLQYKCTQWQDVSQSVHAQLGGTKLRWDK